MTRRGTRRLLWILALLLVPVPFYLGQPESAPTLRLAFLTSLLGAIWVAEGGWTARSLVLLGAAQMLFYTGLFWLLAWSISRLLERLPAPRLRATLLAALGLALIAASFTPLYDTPLSSTRPHSNLFQLFE